MLSLLVAVLVAASPQPERVERASVLLETPRELELTAWRDAFAAHAPDLAPPFAGHAPELMKAAVEGGGLVIAGVGKAKLVPQRVALPNAEAAFRHGITPLISDEKLPAHAARLDVEMVPEVGAAPARVMDALVALTSAACQASSGVAVYFASGDVVHPATYVLAAVRDRLPRGWLWVGFELGGTTAQLTLTSIGLTKVGLKELRLTSARKDIGAAIETYLDLVAMVLARGSDFPDGHPLARKSKAPLVVRHVDGRWAVDYTR